MTCADKHCIFQYSISSLFVTEHENAYFCFSNLIKNILLQNLIKQTKARIIQLPELYTSYQYHKLLIRAILTSSKRSSTNMYRAHDSSYRAEVTLIDIPFLQEI